MHAHAHTHTHTHTHTQCSSTCAGGTHSRNVTCNQMINVLNETTGEPIIMDRMFVRMDTIVADESCPPFMPRRMKDCNTQIPCLRCDKEPPSCPILALFGICKLLPKDFCCKSCPPPITLPPPLQEGDIFLSARLERFLPATNEFEVCCEASSISNPSSNAVVTFDVPCNITASSKFISQPFSFGF